MADSGDLIDFDVIETQKENIQSLPSGRSAKALANLFSPLSIKSLPPSHTQDLNNSIRAEFEKELEGFLEADDPLDICDRYVKWTLDAYPSAQATPQSQLLPLLERSTTAFLHTPHYKNDPRYLKLWLHYIRLFSDAPRETFAFLARHGIGDELALYYEEFAAWLEDAGRWTQAEEIYRLGLEKNARPVERLQRKFGEFRRRYERRPQDLDEPTSPALATVRPALAAKLDPLSTSTSQPVDPQAASRASTTAKSGRAKLAIFSDADEPSRPDSNDSSKGWEKIGSLADRKKENTIEAKPWAGETLKAGKKNIGVPKMMVFKDQSCQQVPTLNTLEVHPSREQQVMNPKTGRYERVFVNLEAVYPQPEDPSIEFCFEELRARNRGWLDRDWGMERSKRAMQKQWEGEEIKRKEIRQLNENANPTQTNRTDQQLAAELKQGLVLNTVDDENKENAPPQKKGADLAKRVRREERANKTRKIRVMEVKGAPQTIQTNLDSPTGPKLKRKRSTEPTMTLYTKAATDEIYEIFNQPLKTVGENDAESGDESSEEDYTSGGDSTGTGRISGTTSEYGEETGDELTEARSVVGDTTDVKSISDLTEIKESEGVLTPVDEARRQHEPKLFDEPEWGIYQDHEAEPPQNNNLADLVTPTPEVPVEHTQTRYIPLPPDDYQHITQPYREPVHVAQCRLPFMTPIVERTESSLGAATAVAEKDYFNSKTPCRKVNQKTPTIPEDGPWSSPFEETIKETISEPRKPQLPLTKSGKVKTENAKIKNQILSHKRTSSKESAKVKGPIIKDAQCNPVDEHIRTTILNSLHPSLSSYDGFFDHKDEHCGKGPEIRKFCKVLAKTSKNSGDRTCTNMSMPPTLRLKASTRTYRIKRELGKGAFAPVYLAESSPADDADSEDNGVNVAPANALRDLTLANKPSRRRLEAIKMEDPPSPWEFYILSTAHKRLGSSDRTSQSIICAHEFHMYADECYLIEDYLDQGTLLDLVNIAKAENVAGAVGQGMDELLAAFYTVELMRTVEGLHGVGIVHGDLKADNVLARFCDPLVSASSSSSFSSVAETGTGGLSAQYSPRGENGWSGRGITLIDFGRGIDMKCFREDVGFIADWETTEQDCAEMREGRHWSWQVDYWGLAACVHVLLWGKYFEKGSVVAAAAVTTSSSSDATAAEDGDGREERVLGGGGGGLGPRAKTYKLASPMKRYWNQRLWNTVFDFLLNPVRYSSEEEGGRMPCLRNMKRVREEVEGWLEGVCERGVGLRALLRRLEERCAAGNGGSGTGGGRGRKGV